MVGVNAAVAQKWPVAPDVFKVREVDFTVENFLTIGRSFGDHNSLRIAEKRSAPKFQTVAPLRRSLMANTIHCSHVDSVCYRMSALNCAPGITLCFSVRGFLAGMPSDCRRIKQDHRTMQCRQPRALWIPLIPADQRGYFPGLRGKSSKAQIPRRKIKFFVIG